MVVGDTAIFVATGTDRRGRPLTEPQVRWVSKEPRLLRIRNGVAVARATGTVTIVATAMVGSATKKVTIVKPPLGPPSLKWRAGAQAPAGVSSFYAAHDAGRRQIILAGDDGRILTYNIASDTWGEIPVSGMPSPRGEYSIAYDDRGDRILLNWRGLGSVWAIPRMGGAAVRLNTQGNGFEHFDHYFAVDPVSAEPVTAFGYGFFTFRNTLWRYTAANQWVLTPQTSPWPWGRQAPAGSVARSANSLFIFGGQGNPSGQQANPLALLHSLWQYNFTDRRWTALISDSMQPPTDAPAGRASSLASTPTGSALYVFGSEFIPAGSTVQTLWRFRPGTDAAFRALSTTGEAPPGTQVTNMFFDDPSDELVVVQRFTPLRVFRVRVR